MTPRATVPTVPSVPADPAPPPTVPRELECVSPPITPPPGTERTVGDRSCSLDCSGNGGERGTDRGRGETWEGAPHPSTPLPGTPDVLADLADVVGELGSDELRVLLVLARRLLAGQRHYGPLDVAHDGRSWHRERAEELADALVYGAIGEVAATLGRGEP
jgi:hypothetical protein